MATSPAITTPPPYGGASLGRAEATCEMLVRARGWHGLGGARPDLVGSRWWIVDTLEEEEKTHWSTGDPSNNCNKTYIFLIAKWDGPFPGIVCRSQLSFKKKKYCC